MSGVVMVTAGQNFPLRVETAGTQKHVELDTFWSPDGEGGLMIPNYFKDEAGENSPLSISNVRAFKKANAIDKHNLEMIDKFLKLYPERASELSINDPDKEMDNTIALADLSFDIETYIRKNSSNESLLAKLYRRIIGQVKGIPAKSVIVTLITLAKEEPNKFLIGDRKVYEDKSFEMFSLVDLCLEKGILTQKTDGSIYDRDGRMVATDIEKMAFQLEGNEIERDTYYKLVDDAPIKSLRYEAMPETAPNVNLSEETGTVATNAFGEMTPEMIRAEIAEVFPKLKDAGFVVQTGAGPTTRYSLFDIPGSKYTKVELQAYFEQNQNQYQDYKQRASI